MSDIILLFFFLKKFFSRNYMKMFILLTIYLHLRGMLLYHSPSCIQLNRIDKLMFSA